MSREWVKNWTEWRSVRILVMVMLFALVWHFHQRRQIEAKQRELLISWCSSKESTQWCEQQLADHHKNCFRSNYRAGTKFESANLNQHAYRQCVIQGYTQWKKGRIKKNKDKQEFLDKIL